MDLTPARLPLDLLLNTELRELEAAHLRRTLRIDAGLLDFASNDYLGLRTHPAVIEAAQIATARAGAGAGAARLVRQEGDALALEAEFATWKEAEAALLFGSGYAAALGTVPALVGAGDTIIADKLVHACLIDAARLSGATLRVYPHNHLGRLEALLARVTRDPGRVLVMTESVFSMDGDTAPLREIVALKERYGAWLLVDEAHATGLYGTDGAGLIAELGLGGQVEVTLATLGKALGSVGGVIAGSRVLVDYLVNRARSFVFSTALPPGAIAASRAAVALTRGPEGTQRRAVLRENINRLRSGLPGPWREASPLGAIQPLLCGQPEDALARSATLRERGFLVPAIRYPTVPRGAPRLRLTLSAAHTAGEIDALLAVLATLPPTAG